MPGGEQENIVRGDVGETRHLRKLLVPGASDASLIRIRHLRPGQLNQDQLADARLTVVAGVAEPGPWTELLLDYVRQGGQVIVAAGGDFQPSAWNQAWADGQGLLPLPLQSRLVGVIPGEAAGELDPFFLDFDSLRNHSFFRIAGVSENDLRDLYSEPLFFQAAAVVEQAPSSGQSPPPLGFQPQKTIEEGESTRWVAWPPRRKATTTRGPARILARFDRQQMPFLVEQEIGEGRVVFLSTGLLARWNTLARTNAVLLLDRVVRTMLQSTLAQRNFEAQASLSVPLPIGTQQLRWELIRPGPNRLMVEALRPGFIGRRVRGATIDHPLRSGAYLLQGRANQDETLVQSIPLAVEAPAEESQLMQANVAELREQMGSAVHFVGHREKISTSGSQTSGQEIWWWLVLCALILLLLEMIVLAPRRSTAPANSDAEGAT